MSKVQLFFIEGMYGEDYFCGGYDTVEEAKKHCENDEDMVEGDRYEIHTETCKGRWVSTDSVTWNWVDGWDWDW